MPDKPLETVTYDIDPRELTLLTKNARRMPQRQFKQLVSNIERDGCLTSAPLIHEAEDGRLVVLLGNHRTKAAIAAGLATIPVMEVKGDDLTAERLLAIQLSHNAITGEDDENILKELYDSLDVMEKLYSGLTDADFGGVEELDLSKLTIGAPRYEEVTMLFLPEDREVFIDVMEKLGKGAAKAKRYFARLEDFELFERAIVAVQDTLNIHNQALAMLAMSELALERLNQLETANGDGEQSSESVGAETPADDQIGGAGPSSDGGHPKRRRSKARGEQVDDLQVRQEASAAPTADPRAD
jgi:hypothetical protein